MRIKIKVLITIIVAVSSLGMFLFHASTEKEQQLGASTLRVSAGGTGANSFTLGECLVGNGTGAITTAECGSGSTGGSSVWSTSTDGVLYYNGSRDFVVGGTATTTDDNFQVIGGLYGDEVTTPSLTINGETFTDLTGTGLSNVGGVLTSSGGTGDLVSTNNLSDVSSSVLSAHNLFDDSIFAATTVVPADKILMKDVSGSNVLKTVTAQSIADLAGASSMVYPDAGIALSIGSAWDTSITNNSANWNTAYGWGDWSGEGFITGLTWSGITGAQSDISLSGFTDDLSYLTSSDINTYSELNTIVADQTLAYAGGSFHDGFSDFVANEHIDWTGASAGTIHATNYVDNNTTYTGGNAISLSGTTFNFDGGVSPAGSLGGTWANPTVDSDSDWTKHNSFPTACSAGEFVTAIGDTLTCAVPSGEGTTYTAGTGLSLTGSTFSTDDSEIVHDNLSGFVANEHTDWRLSSQGTIHATNYVDNNTTYVSSDFTHDNLAGVKANEHIDWTTDQGATNINAGNYIGGDLWSDSVDSNIIPDTDSTYNLGSLTTSFATVYADSINSSGNLFIKSNDVTFIGMGGTSLFLNSNAGNIDTRISGDADTNLVYVDASADNVGIGDNTPTYKLDVNGTLRSTGALTVGAYTLPIIDGTANQVLETNGSGALTWVTPAGATYTAGDGLTLTGSDFDCDTANGSTFGCLTSTDWNTFNNKVTFPGFTSLSTDYSFTDNSTNWNTAYGWGDWGGNIDISTDTNLAVTSPITLTGDTIGITQSSITTVGTIGTGVWNGTDIDISDYTNLVAGTNITLSGDTLNVDDAFIKNTGDTGTGVYNFGGATSFEIPNGTSNTVDTYGEIAVDTEQLIIADSSGTARVLPLEISLFGATIASTSQDFVSGGSIPIGKIIDKGRSIKQFRCWVEGGTSIVMNVSDGTNDTETITCATTVTSDTDVTTNNTFTANEKWELQFGTITGTPNYLIFEAIGYITRE